jgi:hypothetical protein
MSLATLLSHRIERDIKRRKQALLGCENGGYSGRNHEHGVLEGVAFLSFATRLSYQYSKAFTFVETQLHLYLSLLATGL